MMLQTLVENAIKHGLESKPGGGTVWIRATGGSREVSVTVADDGSGFNAESSGTGIGLKNVRERLRLAYGNAAHLSLSANFPDGVAAPLTLPAGTTPDHGPADCHARHHRPDLHHRPRQRPPAQPQPTQH